MLLPYTRVNFPNPPYPRVQYLPAYKNLFFQI